MARGSFRTVIGVVGVALMASSCARLGVGTTGTGGSGASPARPAAALGIDLRRSDHCDPVGVERCMLPFPDDFYTVADPTTATGRRVALDRSVLPANTRGVHIDPRENNRNDGFSPGSALLVGLGRVDLHHARVGTLTDLGASMRADSAIVIVDENTGERWPYFAELDTRADPGVTPTLIIRPARNFLEGHRYAVAIRNLMSTRGIRIAASPAFRAYRDDLITTDRRFERRRGEYRRTFAALARAGVSRSNLQLAWHFTIASGQNLAGRMLAMRDDAFALLGDRSPNYTISSVLDNPDPRVLRQIDGTFEVPLYLTKGGVPGASMAYQADGVTPQRQGRAYHAIFRCVIPNAAVAHPARMSLYGHGLLGAVDELGADMVLDMGERHDVAYCATNWIGLSEEDVGNAIQVLTDLSRFHTIPDRLQQSFLNFLYLGRIMVHAQGFSADPAFQVNGVPLIDRTQLYYDGNSQGAIAGGALMAVEQDVRRGVLAEAGMNYSTLLTRSVDWDTYQAVLTPNYPDERDQLIGVDVLQMLWDRGETDGYAQHITGEPYPNTPRHTILLLGAVGDHQVSEYSLQVEARTLGALGHVPYVDPNRMRSASEHGWGIAPLPQGSYGGSAYFLWDTGSPLSPLVNQPPRDGHDPHDDTPNISDVQDLKSMFWQLNGTVTDVCNAQPCHGPPHG